MENMVEGRKVIEMYYDHQTTHLTRKLQRSEVQYLHPVWDEDIQNLSLIGFNEDRNEDIFRFTVGVTLHNYAALEGEDRGVAYSFNAFAVVSFRSIRPKVLMFKVGTGGETLVQLLDKNLNVDNYIRTNVGKIREDHYGRHIIPPYDFEFER